MKQLKIALVAHDARKGELVEWCKHNIDWLKNHRLYATGTTGKLISSIDTGWETDPYNNIAVHIICPLAHTVCLLSGPLGGDQQIGAMIATGDIDVLIFFCDNLVTQSDLVRLASLYNIPFATNRTTADMIITSPLLLDDGYERIVPAVIDNYKNRMN